ncbi:hypothetical protein E4633_12605 [Geomonas terrae]|uniref:Uncharacterized protein n=1 Tax=Geomonas terrae TaxID=2562681 RepID=A0A4S1CCT5_9BACT|nr:hypothetical protein [Geomonas terrae]TGU71181.1 hypothetical protein E4633_12605 [Geomonas terrae]
MDLRKSKTFNLLVQECHLAKNAILSSFDLLLAANQYQDKDGYFYSAFFHMTIGFERLMKLVIVSDYMLRSNYLPPSQKVLKETYRHDLATLFNDTLSIANKYLNNGYDKPSKDSPKIDILNFLAKFGNKSRYYNLDVLCNATTEQSPIDEWVSILYRLYEENVSAAKREQTGLKLLYSLDNTVTGNRYTWYLNSFGHPMTTFDVLHAQLVVSKSAPIAIWEVIELFSPLYHLLHEISVRASKYEIENKIALAVMPHFEDFFYFFLSRRPDALRRKRWLTIFNS